MSKSLTMRLLKGNYGVCRLEKTDGIPRWASNSEFFSITRTEDELSIVCSSDTIPAGVVFEKEWRILKVEGPLDFSLIGILAPICTMLAEEKISIFAVSTYDTDYILVKGNTIDKAIQALKLNGYEIIV